MTNHIGLDAKKVDTLSALLNDLLANYSIFYQNARGFHWKIRGDKFFELHTKFEELYNDLFIKIDEVAERILTLGHSPVHQFTSYLNESEIKETSDVTDGKEAIASILEAYKILLIKQRVILDVSDKADDEGTNALMSDYIREGEKLVWMYSAYLN